MKASTIITVHYRNSICTITAVQTTLTYIIETTYSQVGHCLRNSVRFASPTGRLTLQLAEDPYLLTSLSKVSLQKVELGCA
jgi:hypothetical protein